MVGLERRHRPLAALRAVRSLRRAAAADQPAPARLRAQRRLDLKPLHWCGRRRGAARDTPRRLWVRHAAPLLLHHCGRRRSRAQRHRWRRRRRDAALCECRGARRGAVRRGRRPRVARLRPLLPRARLPAVGARAASRHPRRQARRHRQPAVGRAAPRGGRRRRGAAAAAARRRGGGGPRRAAPHAAPRGRQRWRRGGRGRAGRVHGLAAPRAELEGRRGDP
mmetsp:Transcript_18199/g.58152  ORF Transcript_18199/g.58152 Transcript_18199/m.58152 type:complete len:222 (+) Transcript_18199:265-930(+)